MEQQPLSPTDHVIATDMLFDAKAAIKDLSIAITESGSPEIHGFLAEELRAAIAQHAQIYGFLQSYGIYDAYNIPAQLQKDIGYAKAVLQK